MSDVHKPMDERVADLEAIYSELPVLFNTRFERVNLHLREMSERIDFLDRRMGTIMQDIRDMRGGVTRQLIAQDRRLDGIEVRLTGVEAQVTGVETRLTGVETRLTAVETRLTGVEGRLGGVDAKLDEILRRLPAA